MRIIYILLILLIFSKICISQDIESNYLRDRTVETKIGIDFHFILGKGKKMSLNPSVRSVFSDSRSDEKMTSYQGLENELCYSFNLLKWLVLNADIELDVHGKGSTEFCYYFSAAPSYKYKRLSFFGELKLSNNRNLSYYDKAPTHYFKYIVGIGYQLVENLISLSAKATFPHNIKTNSFEKVQVKLFLLVILTNHFSFNASYQQTMDFNNTSTTYTPAFNVVYTL